jgi:hypothetical protein
MRLKLLIILLVFIIVSSKELMAQESDLSGLLIKDKDTTQFTYNRNTVFNENGYLLVKMAGNNTDDLLFPGKNIKLYLSNSLYVSNEVDGVWQFGQSIVSSGDAKLYQVN